MEETTKKELSIGEAFGFVFKEDSWTKKILTGGLVTLSSVLILPIPFLAGYQFRLFKNILSGQKPYLPEWVFNKEVYINGLKVLGVGVVYSLPSVVFSVSDNFLFSLLRTAYGLVLLGIMPFAMGKLVETGKFESAFDFRWILEKIKNNIPGVVIVAVGGFLAGIAALVGLIGLVIGVIFTVFWSTLVSTYLSATLYKNAR
jgi:hypothetical protein